MNINNVIISDIQAKIQQGGNIQTNGSCNNNDNITWTFLIVTFHSK
jgi:hypothetical protein